MKVCLINCYSDRNSGDLGIIYGTLNHLRAYSRSMKISAVSSFSKDDPWFKTEHVELRQNVDFLHATPVGRVYGSNIIMKMAVLIGESPLMFLIWMLPVPVLIRFLNVLGYAELVKDILSSDLVISKGGSFLCNRDNYVDKIRLFRELTILKLASKLNKNTIIAGQSIGPVYGTKSRTVLRNVLQSLKMVIVREELCLNQYSSLFEGTNVVSGYDFAFNITKVKNSTEKSIVDDAKIIGLTVKVYPTDKQNRIYLTKLKYIVQHLIAEGFRLSIIPHVRIDDDEKQAQNLIAILDEGYDKHIKIIEKNLSIEDLLSFYNSISLLIGTRLHSTIFALTMGTPAINIGYHGTKAKGVYGSIGLDEWQYDLEELNSDVLINKALDLIGKGKIDSSIVGEAQRRNEDILYSLLDGSN